MNILHTVESYSPAVGGMAEAARQISEGLVRLGHKVTVATGKMPERKEKTINGVRITQFAVSGKAVFGIRGEVEKYRNFLIKSSFDVVTNFAAQQWATDIALPILDRIQAKKVFVPTGFSGFYSPFYKNYFKKMKKWMKQYDMNIFLSDSYRDIDFARKNNIRKIKIIPNGASKEEFLGKTTINIRKDLNIPGNHFLILSVASHTGMKGHSEAIRIFNKASIKKATLLIVGKHAKIYSGCYLQCQLLKFLNGKNILLKDLTREQTVAAFKAADIFLFTSRVECSPLVLFESMAAKTPFLTTDVGNSKEIIKWSKSGILLPTIINKKGLSRALVSESATILEQIFDNSGKRKIMAERGFKVWLEQFTWEKIARQYEHVYQKISKSRP